MSKITAMYIRLSMEDEDVSLNQKEESNSVSSQRELLEAFIGNHSELKDTKVQEYCDDGFTGTKFERPGYMKLCKISYNYPHPFKCSVLSDAGISSDLP